LPIAAIPRLREQLPAHLDTQASALIRAWSAKTKLTQESCTELLQHVRDLIGQWANHE